MKILKNKKLIRKISIAFAGTLLLTTAINAASLTKKIDATFRDIKVFSNNQQKTMEQEPFIYNNSVYLPVRAVGELVNKEIQWVPSTNSVFVSDKGGAPSGDLTAQLNAQKFENARLMGENDLLKKQVKELQAGVTDKDKDKGSGTSNDLKKTLAYIEEAFDYEHSIDWDFKLSETSSRVNVEVSFDSRYDDKKWEGLSKSQREAFFRDISREIRIDFKDTQINGSVVDRRTDKSIGTFTYSKSNSFSYSDNSSTSFSELEKEILRLYKTVDGTGLPIYDIELKGNEDNITFTIFVDLSSRALRDKWVDGFKDNPSKIRDLMYEIQEDIQYEYRHATTQGFIEDLSSQGVLAKFDGRRLY